MTREDWLFLLEFYSVAPEAAGGDFAHDMSNLTDRVRRLEHQQECTHNELEELSKSQEQDRRKPPWCYICEHDPDKGKH